MKFRFIKSLRLFQLYYLQVLLLTLVLSIGRITKIILILFASILISIKGISQTRDLVFDSHNDSIEKGFKKPPDSARPYIWWHWMDCNISKEGITADLEAMKEIGIAGATMFNVSYRSPRGKVPFMSEQWRKLFKHAVQEADRLGLKLGFHNCEGWSASGGFWVSPEQSMKKLTAECIRVSGTGKQSLKIPQPSVVTESSGWGTSFPIEPFYRDIAVFALKSPIKDEPIDNSSAMVSCNMTEINGTKLVDADKKTGIKFPQATPGAPLQITLQFSELVTARSLGIHGLSRPGWPHNHSYTGELQISNDGVDYTKVASFQMIEDELSLSFPARTSRYWRIVFTQGKWLVSEMAISEIKLMSESRIQNWPEKSGLTRRTVGMGDSPDDFFSYDDATEGIISQDDVINLTNRMSEDGLLTWDVPDGDWTILRIGYTTTGKDIHFATTPKRNLECDKLNVETITAHYNAYAGTLVRDAGTLAGRSLNHVLLDSWEADNQNWSEGVIEEFKKRRGYDPLPFLPVTQGYVVNSEKISERFLWDFRRTLADLYAEVYIATMKSLANADGLSLILEAYGNGNFDSFQCMSGGDVPTTEFWYGRKVPVGFGKHASSVTHALGKNVTAAEAFTAHGKKSGWQAHPFALKNAGDIMFADGVNRMVIHTWPHQPRPGIRPGVTFGPWGINFNAHTTWFQQARVWTDYLSRCQYLLQQGRFSADVAIFSGEHAPNNSGRSSNKEKEDMPDGYDYDYVNAELLAKATVKNGRITLPSGASYRLLVLRNSEIITPQFAKKIRTLIAAGALVNGKKPMCSPSLENYPVCDEKIREIAHEVWGNVDGKNVKAKSFGKGKVFDGMAISEILESEKLQPDMKWSNGTMVWQHRRIDDTDVYFVANNEEHIVETELSVRINEKIPELWHPDDGKIETCGVWRVEKGRTIIPLRLAPYESLFVVFRKQGTPKITALSGGGKIRITNGQTEFIAGQNGNYSLTTDKGQKTIEVTSIPEAIEVSGTWKVSFPPELGTSKSVVFNELISLTESQNEGIKYFSGTATYTCDVDIPTTMIDKRKRVSIDLGRVEVIAELFVNGKPAVTLWKPPFKADITDLVKVGKNRIEVGVTNQWRNRLIGDEYKPLEMEWSRQGDVGSVLKEWPEWFLNGQSRPESERVTFVSWRHYTKDSKLIPSGLLGPVRIHCSEVVRIR